MKENSYKQRPLREIWERECYRLSEEPVEIAYHKMSNSIQYKDESGVLTARLFPKTGEEKLYFRDANAPEHSGYGTEVAYIRENGKIHGDTVSEKTGKPAIDSTNISDTLSYIVSDWQFERNEIGVEDKGKIPKPIKADRTANEEAKNDFAEFRKFLAEQNAERD